MDALCKNCRRTRRLERSHSIPNSFFKPLARCSNGQFIMLTDGPSKAERSQDSGRDYLLCADCERLFGRIFDEPLVEEFRNIRTAFAKNESIAVSDTDIVKSGIASIIWRASHSNATIYKAFKIPSHLDSALESELWCESDRFRSFSYSVQPIFDSTPSGHGNFDNEIIENFLVSPKQWKIKHGFSGRSQNGWGAIFIMGGVVVTAIQPRLSPYKERHNLYLLSNGRASRIRPVDMWSVPYLREFLSYAVHKERINATRTGTS